MLIDKDSGSSANISFHTDLTKGRVEPNDVSSSSPGGVGVEMRHRFFVKIGTGVVCKWVFVSYCIFNASL